MRTHPRAHKHRFALLVPAAALLLASCGSTAGKKPVVTSQTAPSLTLHPPARIGPPRPSGMPVGATQRVVATGTTLVVRVTKVIDPLVGSGAKVASGMKPVGVVISVRNAGPAGYDSSATSDFALLVGGSHAMPVFAPTGACQTYIQDFMNELGVGQARTGCIAYAVPRGKTPTAVRLAPDGGTAGHSASWIVP